MSPKEYEKLKWDDAKWKKHKLVVKEAPSMEELVEILAKGQHKSDS